MTKGRKRPRRSWRHRKMIIEDLLGEWVYRDTIYDRGGDGKFLGRLTRYRYADDPGWNGYDAYWHDGFNDYLYYPKRGAQFRR
jgi:hypothetical protein